MPTLHTTSARTGLRPAALLLALGLALGSTSGWAQHDRDRGDDRRGRAEMPRDGQRDGQRDGGRDNAPARAPNYTPDRGHDEWRQRPNGRPVPVLPAPGAVVRALPPAARAVPWGGTHYRHDNGVWYRPAPHGWVVVRPPVGLVMRDLPWWGSALVIGGVSYWLVNDVYYRERPDGYEVVAPPVPTPQASTDLPGLPRQYVYPRLGQSANQQASDEYECHRWAVQQTGFDPTAGATGGPAGDPSRRDDYLRARAACLDGRGYTVK